MNEIKLAYEKLIQYFRKLKYDHNKLELINRINEEIITQFNTIEYIYRYMLYFQYIIYIYIMLIII